MTDLSSNQIAQLTAIVTGGGMKRSATKEAAIKRFLAVAAEAGLSTPEKFLGRPFEQARSTLTFHLKPQKAPDGKLVATISVEQAFGDDPLGIKSNSEARKAALAVAEATKPVDAKPAKAPKEDAPVYRSDAQAIVLDLVSKLGPGKVGKFRAEWIRNDPAGFAKLAPTQQKGIFRKAINRLVETGTVSREGSVFSIAA
jgi:hypothetical protein